MGDDGPRKKKGKGGDIKRGAGMDRWGNVHGYREAEKKRKMGKRKKEKRRCFEQPHARTMIV